MKRTLAATVYKNTRSKKPKLSTPLSAPFQRRAEMISATHLHNYMINDTLVDWLKASSRRGTRNTPVYLRNPGFIDYILKRGVEFESELVKYININKIPVITVSEFITDNSCRRAIELMHQGVPVLHSVPVRNNYNRTQGVIDLLVRSDHFSSLVDEDPLTAEQRKRAAPRLNGAYHYVVVDIKFSTLPLRADGKHLLNSGHYPAYKAQTLIYTQAIGRIQGYTPPYAFIMGRRWKYKTKQIIERHNSCLNRLGKIDFQGVDNTYLERTKKAIRWMRDLKTKGSTWGINPPTRRELYPNMCVDSGHWNGEKRKIANLIGEMTSIWNIGTKHRNQALDNGISSWKDELCTTTNMNFRGKRAPIIDKIMAINRQSTDLLLPKKIISNLNNWKEKSNELYVDFETLSDIFANFNQLPYQGKTNMIFMIGVGWENDQGWHYRNFICNSPTPDEEYRIMNEFMEFINSRVSPRVHYWHAENRFWTTAENRQFERACTDGSEARKDHISDNWRGVNWCDMHELFNTVPIVIKDCFKFGLKAIAKAMRGHNMISATIDSSCDSGMTAMIRAWECYQTSSSPRDTEVMKDISKYNEFDCKVLWEILSYLRANHT